MAFDFSRLNQFYSLLDRETAGIAVRFGNQLKCKAGCADCCVDGITVWAVEAAHIENCYSDLLQTAKPAPEGGCAFLDEQRHCRIYPARPYVCRTQGLPLRWLEENDSRHLQEFRDICPLNEEEIDLLQLDEKECWTIGPFESDLAHLQKEFGKGKMERVALRSLFKNKKTNQSDEE